MNQHILLGGGIAGLTCAHQLIQAGKKVTIFEKNQIHHTQGHAFILMPNGIVALDSIGLKEEVLKHANSINQFQLHNTDGTLVDYQKLNGAVGIRRSTLMKILLDTIPKDCIQFGKGFSHFNYKKSGDIEAAVFQDGTTCQGDIFIGADGIWSKSRREITTDFKLSPVRIREIVSVIKAPHLVEQYKGSFLKVVQKRGGMAVGMLPCDKDHLVWFVQYDSHHHELLETTLIEQKERLFQLIRQWCDPIPELISKTDLSKSYVWHTTDMNPIPTYYKNNLALIGDAAHVLLTLTSQGVSCALEDAMYLANLLIEKDQLPLESIFEEYTTQRKNIVDSYFQMGRDLKEQFLYPMQINKKITVPLAFSIS